MNNSTNNSQILSKSPKDKSKMKKKAVEDGNYGENITYTQNIYNDKVAYSNIINKEENNLKIIQPMKNSKKSLCCTKSCCDSCCVISSDPNVNGQ